MNRETNLGSKTDVNRLKRLNQLYAISLFFQVAILVISITQQRMIDGILILFMYAGIQSAYHLTAHTNIKHVSDVFVISSRHSTRGFHPEVVKTMNYEAALWFHMATIFSILVAFALYVKWDEKFFQMMWWLLYLIQFIAIYFYMRGKYRHQLFKNFSAYHGALKTDFIQGCVSLYAIIIILLLLVAEWRNVLTYEDESMRMVLGVGAFAMIILPCLWREYMRIYNWTVEKAPYRPSIWLWASIVLSMATLGGVLLASL